MRIAITDHAVDRYQERVEGAANLDRDSAREVIQRIVEEGFEEKTVKEHPVHSDRRIVPFKSGDSILYLSLGPNRTHFPGDWAVIGVLFEKEMGKVGMGLTLGDTIPALRETIPHVASKRLPRYVVRIGTLGNEEYNISDEEDLNDLLARRQPRPEDVHVYELQPIRIRTQYIVEREEGAALH